MLGVPDIWLANFCFLSRFNKTIHFRGNEESKQRRPTLVIFGPNKLLLLAGFRALWCETEQRFNLYSDLAADLDASYVNLFCVRYLDTIAAPNEDNVL